MLESGVALRFPPQSKILTGLSQALVGLALVIDLARMAPGPRQAGKTGAIALPGSIR
jgi:hypothetical protein